MKTDAMPQQGAIDEMRETRLQAVNSILASANIKLAVPGTGDYTKERRELYKDETKEEVQASIERSKKGSSA